MHIGEGVSTISTNTPMAAFVVLIFAQRKMGCFIGAARRAAFGAHAGIGAGNGMRNASISKFGIAAVAFFPMLGFAVFRGGFRRLARCAAIMNVIEGRHLIISALHTTANRQTADADIVMLAAFPADFTAAGILLPVMRFIINDFNLTRVHRLIGAALFITICAYAWFGAIDCMLALVENLRAMHALLPVLGFIAKVCIVIFMINLDGAGRGAAESAGISFRAEAFMLLTFNLFAANGAIDPALRIIFLVCTASVGRRRLASQACRTASKTDRRILTGNIMKIKAQLRTAVSIAEIPMLIIIVEVLRLAVDPMLHLAGIFHAAVAAFAVIRANHMMLLHIELVIALIADQPAICITGLIITRFTVMLIFIDAAVAGIARPPMRIDINLPCIGNIALMLNVSNNICTIIAAGYASIGGTINAMGAAFNVFRIAALTGIPMALRIIGIVRKLFMSHLSIFRQRRNAAVDAGAHCIAILLMPAAAILSAASANIPMLVFVAGQRALCVRTFIDLNAAGTQQPVSVIIILPLTVRRAYVLGRVRAVRRAAYRAHAGIGAQNSMRSAGIGIFCIAAAAIFPVLCFIASGHTGSDMVNRKIQTAATATIAYARITAVYIMLFLGAGHAASRPVAPVMGCIMIVYHIINMADPNIRCCGAAAFAYTGIRRHARHRMITGLLARCATNCARIPMKSLIVVYRLIIVIIRIGSQACGAAIRTRAVAERVMFPKISVLLATKRANSPVAGFIVILVLFIFVPNLIDVDVRGTAIDAFAVTPGSPVLTIFRQCRQRKKRHAKQHDNDEKRSFHL